ncbi:MAG: UDP-N-acetylmuramate--L-alanine ligase [Microgenomates group bacterium]
MILDKSSYFLLGIKGAAMANIAVMLQQMGKKVSGVDVPEEFITDIALVKNSIQFSTDFNDTTSLDGYDVFVYSAAHGGEDNPLAKAALHKGMILVSQPQLVGELVGRFPRSIAVAGCHGKTTTSSLLAWALLQLKKDPSFLIGAPPFGGGGGGHISGSEYMVVEADEYGVHPPKDKTPKLLFLHPTYALCTNIDFDHPDVYDSLDMTKKTFIQFFSQAQNNIVCGDDPVIRSLLPILTSKKLKVYGTTADCDYRISNLQARPEGISFELLRHGESQGVFTSLLFGEKNILNCAGVAGILFELGFEAEEIRQALSRFAGAKRRMETVWTDSNSYLIDDYGHHPAEISATIMALKSRFPGKKLHILFQPHTFSRTEELKDAFIAELSQADFTYLLPIFASARENPAQFHITSTELARLALNNGRSTFFAFDGKKELLSSLREKWHPGDVVVTLGAGDIYKLKDDIIGLLNGKSTR